MQRLPRGVVHGNSCNPPNNPKRYSDELHVTHTETILGSQCAEGLVASPLKQQMCSRSDTLLCSGKAGTEETGLQLYGLEADLGDTRN